MYPDALYIDTRYEGGSRHAAPVVARPAPGHPRPAHPQDALLGTGARLRHRAVGGAVDERRAHRGRRLALSGAPPPRGARVDRVGVARLRAQPAREVLPSHAAW